MGTTNPTISLPSNFVDLVSPRLLLQPDHQYLYAHMMRAAGAKFLEEITEIPVLGEGGLTGAGADPGDFDASQAQLSSPLITNLFGVTYDTHEGKSRTMRFNRPIYTDSTATMKSREVKSGQDISTTPTTIQAEQTYLTVTREAGPYDDNAGEVRPFCIDEFDAEFGVNNLVKLVGKHLRRDLTRCHEKWTVDLLDQFDGVYPQNMTAVDDMTTKGSGNFSFDMIVRLGKLMADRKLPTFPGGKWLLILTTDQEAQLVQDPVYRQWAKSHPQFNPIFPGHIGQIRDFEVFRSTTLTTANNTSSISIQYGHAIAPGALGYGMCGAPAVRTSKQDNFGLTPKFIWEEKLALGMLDQRFGLSIRTSESAT